MATTSLTIRYRPVRIGFLVDEGKIDDLLKVAGINSLLFEGISNPILPATKDPKLAELLIRLFRVDVLYPVGDTPVIKELIGRHPALRDPDRPSAQMLVQNPLTQKNELRYLDSICAMDYRSLQRPQQERAAGKNSFVLVRWEGEDGLRDLFSISFGYYPVDCRLKEDFQAAFLQKLNAKECKIGKDKQIDGVIASSLSPIEATGVRPRRFGAMSFNEDGIYIGDENDFNDLVYFWNLRAAGIALQFLPISSSDRSEEFIREHLSQLDRTVSPYRNLPDRIGVYHRAKKEGSIEEAIKAFAVEKELVHLHCDEIMWNGLNVRAQRTYFQSENGLADVDKAYGRYRVSVALPEKQAVRDSGGVIGGQYLVASVSPSAEFEYPEHTLRPPYIPTLDEFYGRSMVFDPWELRVEEDGVGIIGGAWKESLTLHPLPHDELITKLFDYAGIKAEISQPGLLTKRIIEAVGGIEGGRVLKIAGVRKLLQTLSADECIARSEAKRRIWANGEFRRYEDLFIGSRKRCDNTDVVFDFLLEKGFYRAGLELSCDYCRLKNWLSLREIDDFWFCSYCGHKNQTSLHLRNRGDWKFRKSGLFAKDNNQEGAIPDILTILQLYRQLHILDFAFTAGLKLQIGSSSCEIDCCVLQHKGRERIHIGVAECKSGGGRIDKNDVRNLGLIWEKFSKTEIKCFLVFSKTADGFEPEEISLFKGLRTDEIPLILLTNKELEPYHPYEDYEDDAVPRRHPLSMQEMALNSESVYLAEG